MYGCETSFASVINKQNNALYYNVSQLMELQHIGDALSVTISYLLAIESMNDLTRAIIEQEGVTYGLHFAQIQLRSSFFYQQVLQRDDDLPFTINCFQTHLKIATWIYLCDILRRIQLLTKLQNGILQLREGVLTKCSEGYCRMYPNLWCSQMDYKIENEEYVERTSSKLNWEDMTWLSSL